VMKVRDARHCDDCDTKPEASYGFLILINNHP